MYSLKRQKEEKTLKKAGIVGGQLQSSKLQSKTHYLVEQTNYFPKNYYNYLYKHFHILKVILSQSISPQRN